MSVKSTPMKIASRPSGSEKTRMSSAPKKRGSGMEIEKSRSTTSTKKARKRSVAKNYFKRINETSRLETSVADELHLNKEGNEIRTLRAKGNLHSAVNQKRLKNQSCRVSSKAAKSNGSTKVKSAPETPKRTQGRYRKPSLNQEQLSNPSKRIKISHSKSSLPSHQIRSPNPKPYCKSASINKTTEKGSFASKKAILVPITTDSTESSQVNPNEPGDTLYGKPSRLQKELKQLYQSQSSSQLSIISAPDLEIRITRKSLSDLTTRPKASRSKRK